jgi:hypothetical protein
MGGCVSRSEGSFSHQPASGPSATAAKGDEGDEGGEGVHSSLTQSAPFIFLQHLFFLAPLRILLLLTSAVCPLRPHSDNEQETRDF